MGKTYISETFYKYTFIISTIVAAIFSICISGCAGENKRQVLIDSYNETVIEYREAMKGIHQQKDSLDEESYQILSEIGKTLKVYRDRIATDSHMTEEETQEILDWLKECKKWAEYAKQIWKVQE